MQTHEPFICYLNKILRTLIIRAISQIKGRVNEEPIDFHKNKVEKILLVRTTIRMGSSILAMPAVFLFRQNFPHARIDFVGPSVSRILFKNLPIDNHLTITRRFPLALWNYFLLLIKVRTTGYDLAIDVSCSQSAMGSFIVGFSGSHFKVGLQGKWDHWFNVRIPRPAEINKYRVLPVLLDSLGMKTQKIFPRMILTPAEKMEGKIKTKAIVNGNRGSTVGVFIGGRKIKGKQWPKVNFIRLIKALRLQVQGVNVVVFFGPEEKKCMDFFSSELGNNVPLVFESSVTNFAAMILNCTLFISCDSGPMHLACALGVHTIAIFQNSDFRRWGPPPEIAKIIYNPKVVSVDEVLNVSLAEICCK